QQRISSGLPFQFSPDPSRDAACNTCPAGTEIQVSVDSHFAGMSDKGRSRRAALAESLPRREAPERQLWALRVDKSLSGTEVP
ncbi:MAG: hypothetical protein O9248_02330, partial [Rhodobacteraceae bacterium]|nr:hypothetical protein [Paracoccaceae bacterium]